MRKDTVNSMFIDDYKRKNKIIIFTLVIIVLILLLVFSICTFLIKNKKEYVNYTENSDINYRVYLKENKFFEKNYAEEKKQYIASLIDYIDTTFKYNINVEKENVDFKYTYYIDAVVNVKDKSEGNSLYDFTEILLNSREETSHGSSNVNIIESVNIDYNRYNEIIKSFVQTYKLDDIESTLTINMHVETASSCEDFNKDETTESVVSLVIPLTRRTMAINITNDLVGNSSKIMLCNNNEDAILYLFLAIFVLIILIYTVVMFSIYVARTRTAKDVYNRALKKILSNYHPFIQQVDNTFDLSSYKLVAIHSFMDMLEIRDTINQPILMVESVHKNGVHFIIPSNTKILYTYSLKVEDIRKKIVEEKNEEKEKKKKAKKKH